MDFISGSLLCAAYKSMISSLFVPLGSSSRSTVPMQAPKEVQSTHKNFKLGLKTLVLNPDLSHDHHHIIHKHYKVSPPSPPKKRSILDGSTTWTSWMLDDVLGTDSGVAIMTINSYEDLSMTFSNLRNYPIKKQIPRSERVKREFPPPIPLLAQTGNLPCRMPWNWRRSYINGRLVLSGEKVEHHEYFEAKRDNGRLVLKLVPLDCEIATICDVPESSTREDIYDQDRLAMEDVQFAEKDDAEEDGDDVYFDDDDDNEIHEGGDNDDDVFKTGVVCNSVPQSHFEISRCNEKYGDLPAKYFASIHELPQSCCFAHPASAPHRLMATAV